MSAKVRALLILLALSASLRAEETPAPVPSPSNAPTAGARSDMSDGALAKPEALAKEDAADNLPPLPLEACVALALEKNFTVRIQKFSIQQAKDSVTIAQAGFDPTISLNSQKTVDQAAATTSTLEGATSKGRLSDIEDTTLSLSQKIVTGATVTASGDLARDKTNSAFSVLNPAYTGDVSLVVTQPLLQNAGLDYNRAAINRAKLGVQIANLNFKSNVLAVILNVETAYYNLIYAREHYKVQEDSLRLAQQLYDENVGKRQTGVVTDLDVLQAQVGVANARNQLILAEQTVHNDEDILLQALGEQKFDAKVGPVDFPPLGLPKLSVDLSYKHARDNGPNLAIVQATIEQFKLDALTAKRTALPELDVNGGVGYNSVDSSYGGAARHVWDGNGYSWQAGLTLTFPWGLRASRAEYRQALSNLRSEQVTYDQTDQNLLVQIRSAVRAVQTNLDSVRSAGDAAELSQKQYDLQKAKFDAGLATSFDVLQAQNDLENARTSELQAKANLRIAIANLRYLEGSSLDLYHVKLPE